MPNPQGTPIWYELLTKDRAAATAFYEGVAGWTVGPRPDDGPMDYRMIRTADDAVGGLMELPPEMLAAGARPGWLHYIAVDDVDATIAAVEAHGGRVEMGPFDLGGVGRMALIADPLGTRCYVMRGASERASRSFSPDMVGMCSWNELSSPDPEAARDFYAAVFGWTYPGVMPMPEGMGDYVFVDAAGQSIGAVMGHVAEQPPGWTFYFRVLDLDRATAQVAARGGTVLAGPMPVPGGDRIIVATDPEGATFGLVAAES